MAKNKVVRKLVRKKMGRPRQNLGTDYLLKNIPEDDWTEFRAYCGGRGWTARLMLLNFIRSAPRLDIGLDLSGGVYTKEAARG